MDNMFQDTSTKVREFTPQLLQDITNNFSEEHMIGSGGFGSVYKGRLPDNGDEIAIKKLHYMPGLKGNEFEHEFNNLMMVRHQNIVRLVGYCYHEERKPFRHNGSYIFAAVEHKYLCFEYLQRGSLDKHISDESCGLDWPIRYKIITGVCDAVNYLHNGSKDPMYHLDLKPENILLDETMMPKISDFGLSRLFGSTKTCMTNASLGTRGYMPPEYINRNEITPKFDVFSLGVIIIKIVAGNGGYPKCADMSSQEFIDLVHGNWEKRLQSTMSSHTSQGVKTCIEIALRCVEIEQVKRPAIAEIIDELKKVGASTVTIQSPQELGNYSVNDFQSKQAVNKQYASSDNSYVPFGSMPFNDDETIIAPPDSGTRPTPMVPGRVQLMAINNANTPIEENNRKVMLQLTGDDSTIDRPGLDLVAVLDVSGSMEGGKISMMKAALQFVVQKLSHIDRLSVVTFSNAAARLCPLWQITEASQTELMRLINDLQAHGTTNIMDGLLTGLKVLASRNISGSRVAGIMLMSSGEQTTGDAAQFAVGNVPVYTFGFDAGSNSILLQSVADNSMGGKFAVIDDMACLTKAFSLCLASLLTIVVEDLNLTVAHVDNESTITEVMAGSYPQMQGGYHGVVTVSLGDLYCREVRVVIVDLLLPAIESERGADILEITYSYSVSGRLFNATPATLSVQRNGTVVLEEQAELEALLKCMESQEIYEPQGRPYALAVEPTPRLRFATRGNADSLRLFATPRMEEYVEQAKLFDSDLARAAADDDVNGEELLRLSSDLEECRSYALAVERTPRRRIPARVFEELKAELEALLKCMKSQEIYEPQGRPYALAVEPTPRQRFATRGNADSLRLFATPRMEEYVEQAKLFDSDPARAAADDDANGEELLRLSSDLEECRSYALAVERTPRLRFPARGNVDSPMLFTTPLVEEYLEQAKLFDRDTARAVADDDVKKESC